MNSECQIDLTLTHTIGTVCIFETDAIVTVEYEIDDGALDWDITNFRFDRRHYKSDMSGFTVLATADVGKDDALFPILKDCVRHQDIEDFCWDRFHADKVTDVQRNAECRAEDARNSL